MRQIDTMDTLIRLLRPYLGTKHRTNQFQLPGQFRGEIDRGLLYCEETKAGLLLYQDMDHYYRFYYHLDRLDTVIPLSPSKPLVAEIPWRADRGSPTSDISFLTECGFTRRAERERMTVAAEQFRTPAPGAVVTCAGMDMCDALSLFLSDIFDRYTGFLPSRYELECAVGAKRILCAQMQDGSIAGALHFEQAGRVSTIWHLAVAENARNRGVARALLAGWRTAVSGNISICRLWVSRDNATAHRLHEACGFLPDGRLCSTLFMAG